LLDPGHATYARVSLAIKLHLWDHLFGLIEAVSLGAEARGGRAGLLEVSPKHRGQERSENELSTTESRKREPEEEDELEDEVEGEPVDNLDEALEHSEEREDNPISQPLSIIVLVVGKERSKRVVTGNDESSQVCQKLASEVEDNEEEVESANADGSIGLGDTSLLLEVVKGGVLGKLTVELTQVLCGLVLSGHCWLYFGMFVILQG